MIYVVCGALFVVCSLLLVVYLDWWEEMDESDYAAQPEKIRCRDCKYSDAFPEDAHNDMPLKCLGVRYGGVYPDWFCEHAERRKQDE